MLKQKFTVLRSPVVIDKNCIYAFSPFLDPFLLTNGSYIHTECSVNIVVFSLKYDFSELCSAALLVFDLSFTHTHTLTQR